MPVLATAAFGKWGGWPIVAFFFAGIPVGIVSGTMVQTWLMKALRSSRSREHRLEDFSARRTQLSMAIAVVFYYVPGLVCTVLNRGASWAALDVYLRAHLFDGFGLAAFVGIGWSALMRPSADPQRFLLQFERGVLRLTQATFVVALAAVYVAGGTAIEVASIGIATLPFARGFWNSATGRVADELREHFRDPTQDAVR